MMNKKGLSLVLLLVIILAVAGGIFLIVRQAQQKASSENAPPASGGTPETTVNSVDIQNFAFSPSTLTISVGDSVTWTNKDAVQHKIVSDTGSELSSSTLSNGENYSHTFSTAGTYAYHCSIHSTMKGTIVVE